MLSVLLAITAYDALLLGVGFIIAARNLGQSAVDGQLAYRQALQANGDLIDGNPYHIFDRYNIKMACTRACAL